MFKRNDQVSDMTPEFDIWFQEYRGLQQDREGGRGGDLWARVRALESQLDRLAIGNLHARSLAAALIAVERACIRYEERNYEGALRELENADPSMTMPGEIGSMVEGSRALVEGNVYLVQEQLDDAARLYDRAKAITGSLGAEVRANARFNLGVVRMVHGEFDTARSEFELAAQEYESVGLSNKVADCLHQLGLILRQKDETLGQALRHLMKALDHYIQVDDVPGQWRVCDDLARLWLIWSESAEGDSAQMECFKNAMAVSTGAANAAARLWRIRGATEGRLADLSDQLLNHTMTHCEVCIVNDNMPHLLAALAVSKGRIRAVNEPVPQAALVGEDPQLVEALGNDDPRALIALIHKSIPRLNRRGETVAVIDQFGLRGDRLISGVVVFGSDPYWEVFPSELCPSDAASVRRSLRGRDRCQHVQLVASRLIQNIRLHSNRCSMLLGSDIEPTTSDQRQQLAKWAAELDDDVQTLGRWFFPDDLLRMLLELNVTHVVLVPDPLFATVPYAALQTAQGTVVDQPWSLSLVTSALELLRLAYRTVHESSTRPILWMGPDNHVNSTRGGDAELAALSELLSVEAHREQDATLAGACAGLRDGRWVHFRGHGAWKDNVATSGPVFANGEILDRAALESIGGNAAGFLITVACYTGFSTAVGSEAFGSLVDYDRAGLQGALLTRWPIDGPAATPFMRRFYASLLATGHVAKALQDAGRQTRDAAPHPYFWGPFVALGAWETLPR